MTSQTLGIPSGDLPALKQRKAAIEWSIMEDVLKLKTQSKQDGLERKYTQDDNKKHKPEDAIRRMVARNISRKMMHKTIARSTHANRMSCIRIPCTLVFHEVCQRKDFVFQAPSENAQTLSGFVFVSCMANIPWSVPKEELSVLVCLAQVYFPCIFPACILVFCESKVCPIFHVCVKCFRISDAICAYSMVCLITRVYGIHFGWYWVRFFFA